MYVDVSHSRRQTLVILYFSRFKRPPRYSLRAKRLCLCMCVYSVRCDRADSNSTLVCTNLQYVLCKPKQADWPLKYNQTAALRSYKRTIEAASLTAFVQLGVSVSLFISFFPFCSAHVRLPHADDCIASAIHE